MFFPFRRLPRRLDLRRIAAVLTESELSRVETCMICFRRMNDVLQTLEANLSQFGLSFGRAAILALLRESGEGGMTPSELAAEAEVTRATVTGLLDGLERDGLVERVRHPDDRRRLYVQLTPKGRDLIESAFPSHFRRVAEIMAGLTDQELKQLTGLMEKLSVGQGHSNQ